jgi:hypothetical protein
MRPSLTWRAQSDEYADASAEARRIKAVLEQAIHDLQHGPAAGLAWAAEAAAYLSNVIGDCFADVTLGDRAWADGDRDALDRHTRALGERRREMAVA